jgi:hypothetical protein
MKSQNAYYCLLTIVLFLNACALKNDKGKSEGENNSTESVKLEIKRLDEREKNAIIEQQIREKRMNQFDTSMLIDDKRCLLHIERETIARKRFNGELDHKVHVLFTLKSDTLFSKSFTKYDFENEKEFLDKAILYFIKFKSYSTDEKKVILFASVTVPETDWSRAYNIKLDLTGKMSVEEIAEDEE